ncbi:MAG: peptide deformylase, partial [Clostridia bacterium]|nr:peptide deformylase [Clostridia bacterium]
MALLNIRKNGDGILRKKCRPVEEITPRILTLLDDMRETLKDANGVGLAAPQVGVLKRIVLVDDGSEILELINPVIVDTKG